MSEDGIKPLPPKELKFIMFINPAHRRLLIYDRNTSQYLGDLDVSEDTLDKLCSPAVTTTVRCCDDPMDAGCGATFHMFPTGHTSRNHIAMARLDAQLKQDLE
jgi:hypothetical protein